MGLDKEMQRAGAYVVAIWEAAPDPARLRPPEQLSAFRPVKPLVRRVGAAVTSAAATADRPRAQRQLTPSPRAGGVSP